MLTIHKYFTHNNFTTTYVFIDTTGYIHIVATDAFNNKLKECAIATNINLSQVVEQNTTDNTYYIIYDEDNIRYYKEYVLQPCAKNMVNHYNLYKLDKIRSHEKISSDRA